MARQPTAPPGDRIFARVDRFDCECPACGQVIRAALSARVQGKAAEEDALARITKRGRLDGRGNSATAYNPITSTLRCPYCYALYQVGLILWPMHAGRQRMLIPEDQRPTQSQLRRLRSLARGIVATEERKRRGDGVNVYVTAECQCPPGGWKVNCPIHGDPVQAGSTADRVEGPEETKGGSAHDDDDTYED